MRAPAFWNEDSLTSRLLSPAGALYGMVGRLRRRWVRPHEAPVPVICIGNLVAGGAGKTPVALAVARHLIARGAAVHLLSRGYGGRLAGPVRVSPGVHAAADVGDEPLLLARTAPCWIARDRVAGAQAAAADGAQIIVMDDGHQNPTLGKALSIVVIDAEAGFGNGRLIPAGPLREPVAEGLSRADAAVLLGDDGGALEATLPGNPTVLHATLEPADDSRALDGEPVFAFAGIGRPAKFFATLEAIGCKVRRTQAFPDHHPYRHAEVKRIIDAAWAEGALAVTTEKDAVRLPPDLRAAVMTVAVDVAWREPERLDALLLEAVRDG